MSKADARKDAYRACIAERRAARKSARLPAIVSAAPVATPTGNALFLGLNGDGQPVRLPFDLQLRHVLYVGTTGAGKSNAMLACLRQALLAGASVFVLDLHGSHPDSLLAQALAFQHETGLGRTRPVYVVDLDDEDNVLPWNLLAKPSPRTEPAVVAAGALSAIERTTGRKLDESPSTKRELTIVLAAAAELGLPVTDVRLLLDPLDADGIRAWAIDHVTDEELRDGLLDLDRLARDERMGREFRIETVGVVNLMRNFSATPSVRHTFGQAGATFDPAKAADEGALVLVNLQGGDLVDERETRGLLAATLLQRIVTALKSRSFLDQPVLIFCDEAPAYITRDVAEGLAQLRKFKVGFHIGAQDRGQLEEAGAPIRNAIDNNTVIKAVFGQASHQDAEHWALQVVPLDLERPKASMIRPIVIGQRRTTFSSASEAEHEATTDSEAESSGSASTSSFSEGETAAAFHADGASSGMHAGQSLSPEMGWLDTPVVLGQSTGLSSGTSAADGLSGAVSTTSSTADTSSQSTTRGRATTRGHARAKGTSEGLESVYDNLPTQLFSKDEMTYLAARLLMQLPPGAAFTSFRDGHVSKATVVQFPLMPPQPYSPAELKDIRRQIRERSPLALSAEEAQRRYHAHRDELRARARAHRDARLAAEAPMPSPPPSPAVPPVDDEVAYAKDFWKRQAGRIKPRKPAKPKPPKPKLVVDNDSADGPPG